MEGRKTWMEDPGTPVQPKFYITTAGEPTIWDTVTGVDSTFTQGFSFLNESQYPICFFYLEPVPPAFRYCKTMIYCIPLLFDAGIIGPSEPCLNSAP
jgi:hypothetical protein